MVQYFIFLFRVEVESFEQDRILYSASVTDGTGRFSAAEVSEFRERYRAFMKKTKQKATRNLDRFISKRARSRFLCWDVLKRLRSPPGRFEATPFPATPPGSVNIDHSTLIDHFQSIFFTSSEPLRFSNPWSSFSPDSGGNCAVSWCPIKKSLGSFGHILQVLK